MKTNAARPATRIQALVTKHPAVRRILVSGIGFKPGQALTLHSPGLGLAHALGRLGKAGGRKFWGAALLCGRDRGMAMRARTF
jgi:hypothetical protein